MNELSGKAAIAGIGATEFSKNSGRSELRLAVEAALAALADAGIDPAEVDEWRQTVSRNAECPCGSGKKFKHCHGVL